LLTEYNKDMHVKKRTGELEEVSMDKILKRIQQQMYGLNEQFVEPMEVAKKVVDGLMDGITTKELDTLAVETAATLATNHPDYSTLASRIALSNLYKSTPNSFSEAVKLLKENTTRLDPEFCELVEKYSFLINEKINHSRDKIFDYFGYKTLEKSYLMKIGEQIVERPQYMWMRVSIGIWGSNLEEAFKTYDLMSQGMFTHATPTLFNAGTSRAQMSSCFLIANKGDSLEGIMATCTDLARISSLAGGIGVHIHGVRANGSHIFKSGGTSRGILPLLRTYNELARYFDQGGGKRKGSFAVYLEPWHRDIFQFLDIRKNHGKEEMRARDLFTALWVSDMFMERVEENGKWTLFCPNEVLRATGKALQDVYGEEFKELYLKCEAIGIGKEIQARDLWNYIIDVQMETGSPYMAYKDAGNIKSNQKNIGVIKSSNLCIEIFEVSTPEEQAVCNLASVALSQCIVVTETGSKFDHNRLIDIVEQMTRNLNQVIEKNFYPTVETKTSNFNHRPIGIGVQGLADAFAMLGLPFDSIEAKELNKDIFETIYYAALKTSCDIAKKRGTYYSSFRGSPASQGILQFDLWGVTPRLYDWTSLKQDIINNGLFNSLLVALMPTASTGQILGNNECFEPFNSNLSSRRTLAGEFIIVNKHLIRDLEKEGLWSSSMKNKLVLEKGSIQNIVEIPLEIRERYKTAYEISQRTIIDMAADRGAYICQSQSMNLFVSEPNLAKLTSMHFHAWKRGLKTGMYYLRTKAAVDAIQFTVEKEIVKSPEEIACSLDNPDSCDVCGS
jgi:ribonucleoside-diphosphate reductase alpha chain